MAIAQEFKDGYVTFKLTNTPIRWAHVHQPDTAFGMNKWHLEALLSDENAAKCKEFGFTLKDKTDKEGNETKNILSPKKEVLTRAGTENKAPYVVGPDGRTPFTDELGNGTVVNLMLSAKAWNVGGKWILSCYLDGIQVIDHVARKGAFDDLTEGVGEDVPF